MKIGFFYAFISLNIKLNVDGAEPGSEEPDYRKSLMYRGWSNWKSFKPAVLPTFTRLFRIDDATGEELNWPVKEARYYLEAGKQKKAFNVILAFNLESQFSDEVANSELFSRMGCLTRIEK
jgi:hypothetical protein